MSIKLIIENNILKNIIIKGNINITALNLSFKNINSIDEYVFFNKDDNTPKFPNLKNLDLSHNSLNDLNRFKDLLTNNNFANLEILNLENNNITEINNIFFNKDDNTPKFPNLKKLDLSHNSLNTLERFSELLTNNFENLEELYLKNNNLTEINYLYFKNMMKLKKLDLSYNKISILTSESFSNNARLLPNIEQINLNNNYISQLIKNFEITSHKNHNLNTTYLDTISIITEKVKDDEIRNKSIFKYLNSKVKIFLRNNLLIKYDLSKISNITTYNYLYIYNYVLVYYKRNYENRFIFNLYENHENYINHIEQYGIVSFIDYFIYFLYKSSLFENKSLLLYLLQNGTDQNIEINNEIIQKTKTQKQYCYKFESKYLNIQNIIENIKNKNEIFTIYNHNLNDYLYILFIIQPTFFKISNIDYFNIYNKTKINYIHRTFIYFNNIIYNINNYDQLNNIYTIHNMTDQSINENEKKIYGNMKSFLFINNIFDSMNYTLRSTNHFLLDYELMRLLINIVIHFNDSIKDWFTHLFTIESITNKEINVIKRDINFLYNNIQYILLNDEDWKLLYPNKENIFKGIINSINIFLENNNLYLYLLLVNSDELIRYNNIFLDNIISLYKKCALNLYIKKSNNIIFYNLLKYLNLEDISNSNNNIYNIDHLTLTHIDSLIDYYKMYIDELYKNYNIINTYHIEPYNQAEFIYSSVLRSVHINKYISKYLFIIKKGANNITLFIKNKNGNKPINKYFIETYIKIFFDKFRIISGHGSGISNTLSIIPEHQTVYFLAKSKTKLMNFLPSIKNEHNENIPYQPVYNRGLDVYDNYFITRPLYDTQKYTNGMLFESYNISPLSIYDININESLNKNISEVYEKWRIGGVFKINNIFKNVCKQEWYKKYLNKKNRKNNIFIDSIYENDFKKTISYKFIKNKYLNESLKELRLKNEISTNVYEELSPVENKLVLRNYFNKIKEKKSMFIDFLYNILFVESDKSYIESKEIMYLYLNQEEKLNNKFNLTYFLKKNKHEQHNYIIHMCRGSNQRNEKLLKHIIKNILKLHLLVESKKKYIDKLVSKNSSLIKKNVVNSLVENNPIFLENINTKGTQLLNQEELQISLSTKFTKDNFNIHNYNLYKIYQDMSHIINIYQKNYPIEPLRNNYHLNIIVEGLEELYNFIYESYEISYENMYQILKKLLILKKIVFTHINVESVEGVGQNRFTYSNISQSYKKENGTNILHLSEANKERYKVAKNIRLKKKFISNIPTRDILQNKILSKQKISKENLKSVNLEIYKKLINEEFPNFNTKGNQKLPRVGYAQNI